MFMMLGNMKKITCGNALWLHQVTILLALFFTIAINIPIYLKIINISLSASVVNWFFLLTVPVFFFCAFVIIFSLFTWPYVTKVIFIPIILLSSVVSYASYNYGVLFDDEMIRNIIQTDSSEALSYFSVSFLSWFVSVGVIPSVVIFRLKIKSDETMLRFVVNKIKMIAISIVIVFFIGLFFYKDYVSIGRNNSYLKKMIIPNEFVYSTYKFIKINYFSHPIKYREIGLDAKINDNSKDRKPTLMIMVVGETARGQNYPVNGYARNTTPYTDSKDVYSFKNVSSCGTATAISVPCMFSALGRENYDHDRANSQDNVLDILQRVGIDILWKDNDGGDKNVAKHVTKIMVDRTKKDNVCDGQTCFDQVLLQGIDKEIKNKNQLIILHLIGSHGPTYFKRYPKLKHEFTPTCNRSDIEHCTTEQIINTYDNTIMYTDLVLSKLIDKLKAQTTHNTALFYLSDHGESLGEDGIYLHGTPYSIAPSYQKVVPMMLWMSDSFKHEMKLNKRCLEVMKNKKGLSQDYVFHTLLRAFNVNTESYNASLDLFSDCKLN